MAKYVIYDAPHAFIERSALAGQTVTQFYVPELETLLILFSIKERDDILLPVFSDKETLEIFFEKAGFSYDKVESRPVDTFFRNLPLMVSGKTITVVLDAGFKAHSVTALPIERPGAANPTLIDETFENGHGWGRTVSDARITESPVFGAADLTETFENGQGWSRTVTNARIGESPIFGAADVTETFENGQGWSRTVSDARFTASPVFGSVDIAETFEDGQGWSGTTQQTSDSLPDSFEIADGWAVASPIVSDSLSDSFEIANGWATAPPGVNDGLLDSFDVADGWAIVPVVTVNDSFEIADGWATAPPSVNDTVSDSFGTADGWPNGFYPAPTSYWPCEAIVGGQVLDAGTANKPLTVVNCTIGTDQNLVGAGNLSHGTGSTITAPADVWNIPTGAANTGSFISMWFRYSASNDYGAVWGKDESGSGDLVVLIHGGRLLFYSPGADVGAVPADTWHHLVIQETFNGTQAQARIWLNAVLGYNALLGVAFNPSTPMHFGMEVQFGDRTFTGRYDEIAVWSEIACTQGIVDELYARGISGTPVA